MRWSKRSQAATSPETFQVTASKLGDFSPENVLVFENAANGIKAANSAGMPLSLIHISKMGNRANSSQLLLAVCTHFI